ncbi:MAG: ATP-binding protein, partial [Terrimicrobiaceae bacterium]
HCCARHTALHNNSHTSEEKPYVNSIGARRGLGEVIQTIQSVAHRLHHTLEHEHWDRLIALVGEVLKNPSAGKRHYSFEQSDSEDALAAWLREGGVTDAWRIAPVLVSAGLSITELASLREDLPKNAFGNAMRWIVLRMTVQTLLDGAEQSTGRIASLVEAVRSIARQERAELADIDVHEQLRSALGVLDRKLTNVRITQNFSSECGHVLGYPSELAQVWVNLLDNAADAVNGGGEIAIQTRRDDNQTVVEIIDNGPGISSKNLAHIFEPFFTTKGVGSGKGLGLTISQGIVGDRHGGEIEVESKAGETRFIVRLPVRQIERNEGVDAIVATRAYVAELKEQLDEMESRPPPQTPTVSERGFATVFDVPLFAQLDESQRECLSTGTEARFARGEIMLRDGDPSNFFHVTLEGELRATKFFGEQEIFLGSGAPGRFFGEIQILLDVPHSVLIRVVADSRLFRLPRAGFWDLLRCSPLVAREIMRTLATRLRNMEGYTQEREKLIQLGAMAAGLAHELNNPATAARRAAADLRQSVEKVQDYSCELNETLSAEQWQQLVATSQEAVHCVTSQPKLNSLEQSDREEAIECWLDSHKIADAWDLAPALVSACVDEATLETVKRTVPAQDLENAIQWLAANLTTRDLLKSISHSTERISELVSAVKSYSFMDQAPWQEIDVHEGIENTLIILGHKLRNVTVTRDFDRTLPCLCAYGGELNQVWTNLIDNAIYAVGGTGRIDIRTRRDGELFLVEIADNGSGIPPEARPHIFAVPFFTTKGHSGTGLGLVISHRIVVERHNGKIDFSTGTNGTQFNVRLPFESPAHA